MTSTPAVVTPPGTADTATDSGPRRSSRRRATIALVVVIALLLGFGIGALLFRRSGPTNFDGAPSVTSIVLPASGAVPEASPTLEPAVVAEPASARAALEQFLAAEVARRPEISFSLLDTPSRARAGNVAAWLSDRANRLLPETFSITAQRNIPEGVELTVRAVRTPAITPLTGLVPARSTETWRVVNDGGWRVSNGRPFDVRPELPPDARALDAAARWLDRTRACDEAGATALQLSPSLLGSPDLGDAACDAPGSFSIGGLVPLSELPNSTVFVSAYGPGVGRWARAVAVDGDDRFTIVLAPLGDEWRVMGLVPAGSPRP